MWDRPADHDAAGRAHLTHDLMCGRCGHAVHTYLACSDACACEPCVMPGATSPVLAGSR